MAIAGKRWTVTDRLGNQVYLTQERWQHITDPTNHPEMSAYEEHLMQTIRTGKRKQDSLNPSKYRYTEAFGDLAEDNTHVVAIVLFRFKEDETGAPAPNNYVITAYLKELG